MNLSSSKFTLNQSSVRVTCRNSGNLLRVYRCHIDGGVCVLTIEFHFLHTCDTFASDMSSKYEKIFSNTSTGNVENGSFLVAAACWAAANWSALSPKAFNRLRSERGGSGSGRISSIILNNGPTNGRRNGKSSITSISFSMMSSSTAATSISLSIWGAGGSRCDEYGGSSLPESSSLSDRSVKGISSINGNKNAWHVPQTGSPKFGP